MIRECSFCKKDISYKHLNRKYCSDFCMHKARYKISGKRSTPEQRKEWYKKRKLQDGYVEKLREQGKLRYYKVQDFLRNYKLSKGCTDCGYDSHHAALEFDHVLGEKEINVCFAKSISQAKKEIVKCEVVCSNCHKIRTFERLQDQKSYEEVTED